MQNAEIAKLFEKAGDVLAVMGENVFRVNAFKKIARTLEEMATDVKTLAETGELDNVAGIGKSSAEKIREYLRTGKIGEFEDLFSQIPVGVMQMMRIPTVGPKTVAVLWKEGGVTSVEELKKRIEEKTLGDLPGVGEKKLAKILENIAHLATSAGRIRIGDAMPVAVEIVSFLKTLKQVKDAQYCGSLRRGKETIGDVDIAVSAEMNLGMEISDAVTGHRLVSSVIQKGESKTSFRTTGGLQVDVRVVPAESWGAALQYFTGSQEHNVRLREMAVRQGLKLNEWGLFKGEKAVAGADEKGVYEGLGLVWVPPEMRENRGEVEAAVEAFKKKDAAVFELVEIGDIRGELHMHTVASDGMNSIEEMVGECKRRGMTYCAITDHSKSQFQANGLKVDRLIAHAKAVRAISKEAAKSGMLVLAGSEVDILADGSLDYEDEVLEQLDWVVASPHAALTQESEQATTRLVRACANPHVCVIGHPTGRIVPSRRGLEPDLQKVIFAAARNGVALEINANTHRLDLRDTHVKMAVEAKVPICINTDAHCFEDMDQLIYGVLTARRGWARKADVLNARSVEEFKKWLKERKEAGGW